MATTFGLNETSIRTADEARRGDRRPTTAELLKQQLSETHEMYLRVQYLLEGTDLVYALNEDGDRYFLDHDSRVDFQAVPGQWLRAQVTEGHYVVSANVVER